MRVAWLLPWLPPPPLPRPSQRTHRLQQCTDPVVSLCALDLATPRREIVTRCDPCRLALQYTKKKGAVPKCGDCRCNLRGVKAYRPKSNVGVPKRTKHVSRAYGGARCGTCVRNRIIRCVDLVMSICVEPHLHMRVRPRVLCAAAAAAAAAHSL